jgi:hypothetical protein
MVVRDGERVRPTRLLAALGLLWGLSLLLGARPVTAALCPEYPRAQLWVVRVLGARLVAQHAAVLIAPTRPVLRTSSAVDLLHAASMVPLLRSARYGRAARISGATAAAYAALAATAAPRSERG